MQKLFTLFVFCFSWSLLMAQEYTYETEVVELQKPQTFYLNSGARSYLGGKSREVLKIQLPPNTVEWFYVFSTSSKPEQASEKEKEMDLTKTLISLGKSAASLASKANVTSIAASAIMTPSGGEICDIYIMDTDDASMFLNKDDNFRRYTDVSRTNVNSGTVKLTNGYNQPIYYLGIRNPTATVGFYVTVAVSAVVRHKNKVEVPETVQKAQLYGNLAWKQFEKGNYEKCIELSKKGLEFDNNQAYIHFNIGLSLLALNKSTDALEEYINAIAIVSKSNNPKYYLKAAIEDIDNLEKEKGKIEGTDDMKQVLRDELLKYKK